jgi:hypothetical protein
MAQRKGRHVRDMRQTRAWESPEAKETLQGLEALYHVLVRATRRSLKALEM